MMAITRFVAAVITLTVISGPLEAGTIYVDQQRGTDGANGLQMIQGTSGGPVRSIARAVKTAEAGDTVYLVPTDKPYNESIVIRNKSGLPDKPIIIEGNGAVLDGAAPLQEKDWEKTGPDLYRSTTLHGNRKNIVYRLFFIFDGVVNRMGTSSKGPRTPFLSPGALQAGQWTYVESEGAFYVRTAPGKPLGSVSVPMLSNGVSLSGNCEHILIRNLTVRHFWNDGFNIHERTRDVRFQNVRAFECGDDGLSAHEDCWIEVDGFVASGNSTGICNINKSHSINRNVVLFDNHGYELYLLDDSEHTFYDSIIRCGAAKSVSLLGNVRLVMENTAVFNNGTEPRYVWASGKSVLEADRLTVTGTTLCQSDGACLQIKRSIVGGYPAPDNRAGADMSALTDMEKRLLNPGQ